MRDYPRLNWLNGKTRIDSQGGRSGASGHGHEQSEANIEHASRTFAKYVDKILAEKVTEQ